MSTPVPSGPAASVLEDLSVRMARVETDVSWIKREMATRADIAMLRGESGALRGELKADIAGLRAELRGDIAGLRAELKGDLRAMETRLVKWMVATALTSVGVAAAAATAAAKLIA